MVYDMQCSNGNLLFFDRYVLILIFIGDISFIRDVKDWEFGSLVSFMDILYSTKVGSRGEGLLCWNPYNAEYWK